MLPELKEKIFASAEANGRSMNAEIVSRLEQSFETDEFMIRQGASPDAPITGEMLDALEQQRNRYLEALDKYANVFGEMTPTQMHRMLELLELWNKGAFRST